MWYLLRYRLSKKLPTLFCLRSWEPMLFREDGAFEPSSHRMAKTPKLVYAARDACRPENGRLWVLDDESKLKTEYDPPGRLNHGQVFLIQTTDVESHDEVVFQEWVQVRTQHFVYRTKAQVFCMLIARQVCLWLLPCECYIPEAVDLGRTCRCVGVHIAYRLNSFLIFPLVYRFNQG